MPDDLLARLRGTPYDALVRWHRGYRLVLLMDESFAPLRLGGKSQTPEDLGWPRERCVYTPFSLWETRARWMEWAFPRHGISGALRRAVRAMASSAAKLVLSKDRWEALDKTPAGQEELSGAASVLLLTWQDDAFWGTQPSR